MLASWRRIECSILHFLRQPEPPRQAAWLALAVLIGRVLTVLGLLGVDVPEQMQWALLPRDLALAHWLLRQVSPGKVKLALVRRVTA